MQAQAAHRILGGVLGLLRVCLTGFRRCVAGSAAVEFAVILPGALLLYVGAAEVSDGVLASRRTTTVAKTLVDLVALQGTTTQTQSYPTPGNATTSTTLGSLLTSAASLMAPEPTTTLTMTITAIDVKNTAQGVCCSALVRWSFTQSGTLRPCITQITALPASSDYGSSQIPGYLLPTGTALPAPISIIVADVGYTYQPIFNTRLLNFAPTMQRTAYMLPRATGQVVTGALPVSGTQNGVVCY